MLIGKKAKHKICNIVHRKLDDLSGALSTCLNKKDWQCTYDSFTAMRRFIEFEIEGCK